MYTLSLYFFLAALVAVIGALFFLASVIAVLLQAGSRAIASGLQRHARSVASAATAQLQPKETAVHTRMRA